MAGKTPSDQPSNNDLEAPPKPAAPEGSQRQIAWQLNQDGIALLKASKPGDATAKFRDAVARVPEAPYFLNLCISYYWEGKFGDAITACSAVDKNDPSESVRAKTDKMFKRIKDEAARQGIQLNPVSEHSY